MLRNKDAEGAEKVLRELREKKPEDQTGRLQLAGLIHNQTKEKREEAISILKQPITDPGTKGVVTFRNKYMIEQQTYLDLTNYLIGPPNIRTVRPP